MDMIVLVEEEVMEVVLGMGDVVGRVAEVDMVVLEVLTTGTRYVLERKEEKKKFHTAFYYFFIYQLIMYHLTLF
jgi:hypothetical protein